MDEPTTQQFRERLEAIVNGPYGQCRGCQGPIAIERLEAQPDAVICVKCAAQAGR